MHNEFLSCECRRNEENFKRQRKVPTWQVSQSAEQKTFELV